MSQGEGRGFVIHNMGFILCGKILSYFLKKKTNLQSSIMLISDMRNRRMCIYVIPRTYIDYDDDDDDRANALCRSRGSEDHPDEG